uniref:Uncharacterized protein n=1 Tax=Wuchereria bancrofti TaxID=6293 RepID=A0A1I8EIT7_WUCBA
MNLKICCVMKHMQEIPSEKEIQEIINFELKNQLEDVEAVHTLTFTTRTLKNGRAPSPSSSTPFTSSLLSSSWRSPTDSNRQAHSTVSASSKPTTPRLDAQTLQHAVAGLRKTEYGRSLQGDIENLSNGRLDGTDQQLSGRYRSNGSFDVPLERNQTGTTFYASSNDTRESMPIGNVHRHSDALSNTSHTERSSFQQQSQTMPFSSYHSYQQQSQTAPLSTYHKNQQQSQTAPFSSHQGYHQQSQTAPFSSYHNNQHPSQTAPFSSYQNYHQQSQTAPFSSYHSDQQQQQQYSSTQYQSNLFIFKI